MKNVEVSVTSIANPDVRFANTKWVHPSVFLCAINQIKTDNGLTGLGEAYGAARKLAALRSVAPALEGLDLYDLRDLCHNVETALPEGGRVNVPMAVADQ